MKPSNNLVTKNFLLYSSPAVLCYFTIPISQIAKINERADLSLASCCQEQNHRLNAPEFSLNQCFEVRVTSRCSVDKVEDGWLIPSSFPLRVICFEEEIADIVWAVHSHTLSILMDAIAFIISSALQRSFSLRVFTSCSFLSSLYMSVERTVRDSLFPSLGKRDVL